mgnify:CR=1 FL=1
MARHRGRYDPKNSAAYELSRSKVELFVRCPACFWLDRVGRAHFPSIPGFNLNSNTDRLLKRDFNQYRGIKPHAVMRKGGLTHLRPFAHEHLDLWENSLHFGLTSDHFNTLHQSTNILFGGGLDDVWENIETGELHIVDYKSTAQLAKDPEPITLEGIWKEAYKRQMDMYQWVMRRKGFNVSDTGYFLYVDGQHKGIEGMIDSADPFTAWMKFDVSILVYEGNDQWVEPILLEIKELLDSKSCPDHNDSCDHGRFLQEVAQLTEDK